MILIQGRGISGGTAQGRLHCFHRVGAAAAKKPGADPAHEKARLAEAQDKAKEQLGVLTERCRQEAGGEAALVFATHAMLVEDEDYIRRIQALLDQERCCAEYAVLQVGRQCAAVFETVDDDYMRERGADVLDVTWRLLRNLAGAGAGTAIARGPIIFAADDLNPSEFIELDREQVLAIVTRRDSQNSHAAILAKLLGIPVVCGLGDELHAEYHGRVARVDGTAGTLVIF